MSIKIGSNPYNPEEVGGIKYLGRDVRESDKEDINAVFWKDKLIWPTASKYLFWCTDKKFIPQFGHIIEVEPSETDVTIYFRSCTRFFKKKYPVIVNCGSSNWIEVNGQQLGGVNEILVMPNNDVCEEGKPDGSFNIHIDANASPFERRTTLILWQTDDLQNNAPTGKKEEILIIQKGDYPDKNNMNYNNLDATWYTGSDFITSTDHYGTSKAPVIGPDGGSFNVYFMLYMNVRMVSGYYSRVYYGENGENINNMSLVSEDGSSKISNLKYLGSGMWQATVNVTNSISAESVVTPEIVNIDGSYDWNIDKNGGKFTVTWETYATISSKVVSHSLSLYVSEKPGVPVSSVISWQGGGSYYKKVTSLTTGINVPAEYGDDVKLIGDVTLNDNNHFEQILDIKPSSATIAWFVNNLEIGQSIPLGNYQYDNRDKDNIDAYSDAVVRFLFSIIEKGGIYPERKFNINIYCTSPTTTVSVSKTITQLGDDQGSSSKELAKEDLDPSKIIVSETPIIGDNRIFKRLSSVSWNQQKKKWLIEGNTNKNPKIESDCDIMVISAPSMLPYKENDVEMTWSVVSGVRNSQPRTSTITIEFPKKFLQESVGVTQLGSNDREEVVYHNDLKDKTTLKNLTDGMAASSITISGNLYTGIVRVSQNNTIGDDTNIAYVKPTSVGVWSVGDIDNLSNAAFYVGIRGKNVYKGKERNVTFKIEVKPSASSKTSEETVTATQLYNPSVQDATSDSPCVGLDESSFMVTDDSQGYLIENSTFLLSKESGIYKVPVHILENTDPSTIYCSFMYDNTEYHGSLNVTLPNIYDTLAVPFSASWHMWGIPVDRRVTLVVDLVDKEQEMTGLWESVPFTGDMSLHPVYGVDYKVTLPDGCDWIRPSSTYITFSANETGNDRTATCYIEFIRNGSTIKSIPMRFTQHPTSINEGNYVFTTNIDLNKVNKLDNGDFIEFEVESYDKFDVKPLTLTEEYDKSFIYLSKSQKNGICTYKVQMSKTNDTSNPIYGILKISQWDRSGNQIVSSKTVKICLPSYSISMACDKTYVDPTDPTATITISSKKKIIDGSDMIEEDTPFTIMQSDSSFGVIEGDGSKRFFICTSANLSGGEKKCNITATQKISGQRASVTIKENYWSENDLNTSDVDLYMMTDVVKRKFTSSINGIPTEMPKIEYIGGNLISLAHDNQVNAYIEETSDGKFNAIFSLKSMKDGDNLEYGIYKISNSKWTIGSVNVYRHAFLLDATTEANDGTYTWFVSSYANELWSLYYVTSRRDGVSYEYDIMIEYGDYYIYKEGNIVVVKPNEDNLTNNRIKGLIKIVQKDSKKTINVNIEQITRDEDYIINY